MNSADEDVVRGFLKFAETLDIRLYEEGDNYIGDDERHITTHRPITPDWLESIFDEWEKAGHERISREG